MMRKQQGNARIGNRGGKPRGVRMWIGRRAAEGDVMDIHARLRALQQKLEEHVDPAMVELHVQADGWISVPAQVHPPSRAERDDPRLEIHFRGGVHEGADIAVALGPDEGDEIGRFNQTEFCGNFLQPFGQHFFALLRVRAILSQHLSVLYRTVPLRSLRR
jgi:hypothetical protein